MAKKIQVRPPTTRQEYESTVEPAVQTSRPGTGRQVNFQEEYRYIVSDLKRVGILAALILSSLVVLSFFIH